MAPYQLNPSPRLEIAIYINGNTVGNRQNVGTGCVSNNELHCLLDALKKKGKEKMKKIACKDCYHENLSGSRRLVPLQPRDEMKSWGLPSHILKTGAFQD